MNPYCEKLQSRFDDYHDGLLSPFLARVIRRHLSACPACAKEYDLLARTIAMIRKLDAPDVPPRVLRKVIDMLSGPGGGAPFPGKILGPDLLGGLESP